jgi:hypothetical protein
MTKPSDIKFAEAAVVASEEIKSFNEAFTKPSDVKVEKKRPSTPVRNPAFREHEGLRALQRELHQRPVPRKK